MPLLTSMRFIYIYITVNFWRNHTNRNVSLLLTEETVFFPKSSIGARNAGFMRPGLEKHGCHAMIIHDHGETWSWSCQEDGIAAMFLGMVFMIHGMIMVWLPCLPWFIQSSWHDHHVSHVNNIVNSGYTTNSHFVRASHKSVIYTFAQSLRSFTGSAHPASRLYYCSNLRASPLAYIIAQLYRASPFFSPTHENVYKYILIYVNIELTEILQLHFYNVTETEKIHHYQLCWQNHVQQFCESNGKRRNNTCILRWSEAEKIITTNVACTLLLTVHNLVFLFVYCLPLVEWYMNDIDKS